MWIPSHVVFPRTIAVLSAAAACLVLGGAAACSSVEHAPAVGTVAVTTPRARVPLGGPLDLTYRFERTGEPIDGDYTVFVHIVNADGQVIWTDDHAPATPTSAWQPGTPVEYTRTIFLPPGALHPGDVGIEVGLYRDGERLPLDAPAAGPAGTRAYRVAEIQLAPETENIFLIYQTGWYADEFAADAPGRSWKWTEKSATIAFRHPHADAELFVEVAGQPAAFPDGPQQVTILGASGEPLATFPVESTTPTLYRVPVSNDAMGTADLTELRFVVDRTFVPAQAGIGQDTRELGVQVFTVYLGVR